MGQPGRSLRFFFYESEAHRIVRIAGFAALMQGGHSSFPRALLHRSGCFTGTGTLLVIDKRGIAIVRVSCSVEVRLGLF